MFSGTLKEATKENFPLSLEHEEYPVSKYVPGFFFFIQVFCHFHQDDCIGIF